VAANIVALAAIAEITGIVSRRSLEKALLARVPRGTEELNKKALSLGVKPARERRIAESPPQEESPQIDDM
jgi:2-oxoglutarate ferredoxin oxidoreductase subunit gamma